MSKRSFCLVLVLLLELFGITFKFTFAQTPELSFPIPVSTDKIDVISPPSYLKVTNPIKVEILVRDSPKKVELLAKPLTSPMLFWVDFFSKKDDTFEAIFDPENFPNGKYQLAFLVTSETESYLGAGPQIEVEKPVPRDKKAIEKLKKDLEKAKKQKEELKNEIEEGVAKTIEKLKKYIDGACAGKKSQAKREIEEKFNTLVELLGKKHQSEIEINKLKKRQTKVKELKEKKEGEIKKIESEIGKASPDLKKTLEKQKDERKKIVSKLEKELKNLKDKIDDLWEKIDDDREEIEELKKKIIETISALSWWRQECKRRVWPPGISCTWKCEPIPDEAESHIKKILNPSINQLSQKYARFFELEEKLQEDSDEDKLIDLKEIEIGTDPFNADSDFDGFLDGIEVALGFDPKKPSPADKMIAQDPRRIEALDFEVVSIEDLELITLPTGKMALKFQGKGFKNSFGILHVFSLPLVLSVKVDQNGNWEYILKNPLSPGEHFSYIVFSNNKGEIISRSEAFYFFLTAGELPEIIPGGGKKDKTPPEGKTHPKGEDLEKEDSGIKPPKGEIPSTTDTTEREKVAIFPYKLDIYQVTIFVAVFFVIILILGGYYIFSQRR